MESDGIRELLPASGSACGNPQVQRWSPPSGYTDGGLFSVMPLSRMAQMVVKQVLELQLEPIFDQVSYGYRPGKSAHQAVESCHPVPQV